MTVNADPLAEQDVPLAGGLPLSRQLTVKILFSFISFLLLALTAIGATLLLSWQLEGGAAAINDAGSLRMRTFQLARELDQVARQPASVVQLTERIGRFEQTLQRLEQGDPARPLLVPRRPDILAELDLVRRHWNTRMRPILLAAASQAQGSAVQVSAFDREIEPFVSKIDLLVGDIEQHNARKTEWLRLCQTLLATLAVLGTVALIYLMFLLVIRPLERLHLGIQRLAKGDFSSRVPVETQDEFGEVASGFNDMARRLAEANATLEFQVEAKTAKLTEKNRELSLLYEIAAFLNQPATLEELSQGFLNRVLRAFAADGGAVRLSDTPHGMLFLVAESGLPDGLRQREHCLPIGECICGEAAASGAVRIEQLHLLDDAGRYDCQRAGFAVVSSFAISTQSRLLGVFNLHFRQPRIFTRQQQQLLETLGQNLAVALDNQRLAAKARELAVLEERNLVAQGLHDSIAQGLSFLNLQAQMLDDALRRDDRAAMGDSLAQIQAGVQESYDDVRELLTNFRTSLAAVDLFAAVDAILERFRRQTGLRVEVQREGGGAPLLPEQQLQLLFILQESLSNVRKHARASRVVVRIEDDRDVRLIIRDDGVGFDAQEVAARPSGHFGLAIMRERAQRAGAALSIEPVVPHGTLVCLHLPHQHRLTA
ncbi:type IV pili methyl-accepting chemotaxis transducer N-terminal domain-containing protein [Aquaspirillum sp. LM1]|uniref:type IV pili methyl-accepting chemotaxis transducer N-terminal domain-containing protein n=1 Tax=Aquaspirillum sp. LM1 TaxID=1938604 RepID=UPI0015C52F93|nr:type IV pili methyl-accepting chemotaxis transducer N-terminal domain-containing protein [Aquaspirillum sp. LM1]